MPVTVHGSTLQLAMVAPDDIETITEAELITGYHVEPVVSLPGGIERRSIAASTSASSPARRSST